MSISQSSVARSILSTLSYSDHFGFPLTLSEIHLRLIAPTRISQTRLRQTLNSLLKSGAIIQTANYYHLPSRSSLVTRRQKREQSSLQLRLRAHHLAHQIAKAPGVLAVYLTGSLSVSNAPPSADIDLLIIARPRRLWTTRAILTLITTILGLRRTPNSTNNQGKICLNLYLTPDSYLIPPQKRNLYTAYELIQAIPLYDPYRTHRDLLFANRWVQDYLPNQPAGPGPAGPSDLPAGPGPIKTLLEYLLYRLQLAYMKRRITCEHITKDSAYFHPRDPGRVATAKVDSIK